MTTTKSAPTDVVVVDGSNIATEGRSMPSLAQLNDAVNAFRAEYPNATITVVVDATFGHRIDKSEVAEFDAAVAHNELVAPPAGAIGRGDAFVLSIANKVGARILTNDSFQEFHGQYAWLFDEGRLIGGKPVPHVGWVFVNRLPVKGPTSRKAQRAARGGREDKPSRRTASKAASQPMPVPTAPPPGRSVKATAPSSPSPSKASTPPPAGAAVNDLLPFLEFVEKHPIGSSVNGVVESYSSHGAYVLIGDVHGYVPLRLMGDPPPRSAREVMRVDDAVTLVVMNFAPARRSVDLAVPAVAPGVSVQPSPELDALAEVAEIADAPAPSRRSRKKAAAPETPAAPAKRTRAKKTAAAPALVEPSAPEVTPAPARRSRKKAAAEVPPVEAPPAETRPTKRTRAKKAAAVEDAAPTPTPAPAKKAATKQATAKTAAAKAAAPATKAPARKKAAAKKPAAPVDGHVVADAPVTRRRRRGAEEAPT